MIIEVQSADETKRLGEKIGRLLRGGEILELVGDIGAGKTTFVKGLARGLTIGEPVQSPTFTISQVYEARDGLRLAHYDFYRLSDPGIMAAELAEATQESSTITVIEWADTVANVLSEKQWQIHFLATSDEGRTITLPDELEAKL